MSSIKPSIEENIFNNNKETQQKIPPPIPPKSDRLRLKFV